MDCAKIHPMVNDENPILYRHAQSQKRRPLWKKALAWTFYPLMMLVPLSVSNGRNSLQLLFVFAHLLYFCGRPLMESISTLATEKQRGTYDCLATAGFSVHRWITTLFRLGSVPHLIQLALFGWLLSMVPAEPWQTGPEPSSLAGILPVLVYTASCVIFYAAAGLWISATSRTLAKAQLKAAIFLGFTFIFVIVLDVILEEIVGSHSSPVLSGVINPVAVTLLYWQGGTQGRSVWVILALIVGQLGLAKGLLTAVERRLERPESPIARISCGVTHARFARFWSHPIYYQAAVRLQCQRWAWLRVVAYPLVLISMRFIVPSLSSTCSSRVGEDTFVMAFFAHMVYVTVRATVAGSAAIAEERENRTWESLLSTRMTPLNLLTSLWVTRVLPAVIEPLPWVILWAAFTQPFGGPIHPRSLVGMLGYSFLWTAFVGTLSLWNSSRSSSAAGALRATALTLTVIIFGGLFCTVIAHDTVDTLGFLSPAVWIEAFFNDYHRARALVGLGLYAASIPILFGLTYKNIRSHKLA